MGLWLFAEVYNLSGIDLVRRFYAICSGQLPVFTVVSPCNGIKGVSGLNSINALCDRGFRVINISYRAIPGSPASCQQEGQYSNQQPGSGVKILHERVSTPVELPFSDQIST